MIRRPPKSTLFPYTPLSRSGDEGRPAALRVTISDHPPLLDAEEPLRTQGEERHDHGEGGRGLVVRAQVAAGEVDRKSTRLNSSHLVISYAVFCLKKKKQRAGRATARPAPRRTARRPRPRPVGPTSAAMTAARCPNPLQADFSAPPHDANATTRRTREGTRGWSLSTALKCQSRRSCQSGAVERALYAPIAEGGSGGDSAP